MIINDITADWHPASQTAVVALATAEQLPAKTKEYAV
jgi:hypothetical protein